MNEKVALQLAGLQAQVALGEPKDSNRLDYYSDVDTYLPQRISRTRVDEQWVSETYSNIIKIKGKPGKV